MTASARVGEFEELRPHLLAVAYRLTGTFADAEDIVQDAWLRWEANRTQIADLRAWLTTVVSRLGLDRLRSAAHRREVLLREWLPEPVVTGLDANDPLNAVVAGEDARFAAMVVLERLTPISGWPSCCTTGSACRSPRSPVSSASATPRPASWPRAPAAPWPTIRRPPRPDDLHNQVAGELMAALATGELDAVVRLLHPDVTFTGDSNRRAPTAARVIHGPGQGGPVHPRTVPALRAELAGRQSACSRQRSVGRLHDGRAGG